MVRRTIEPMVLDDLGDNRVDSDPLLIEHRAALFELRENLARLKQLLKVEEPDESLSQFEDHSLQAH
jgi:hypothetical protein